MKYFQGYRKLDQFYVLLSIFITSIFISRLYNDSSLKLTGFPDRVIGQTVLHGIDAGARTFIYVELILSFILLFFTILLPLLYTSYLLKKSRFKITMKNIHMIIIAGTIITGSIILLLKPVYYQIYLFLWTILFGFYYLQRALEKIKKVSPSRNNLPHILKEKVHIKIEKKIIFILSLLTVFNLLLILFTFREIYLYIFFTLLIFLFLCFSIIGIKKHAAGNNTVLLQIFRNYNIITLSFLFPVVLYFMIKTFIGGAFIFRIIYFPLYILSWLLFYILYYFIFTICIKREISKQIIDKSLILAGIPLIFIPLSLPVINELQFSISHKYSLDPRELAISFIIVLFIISFSVFTINIKKKRICLNSSRLTANIYFPVIVATSVLYKNFTHFLEKDILDMFHLGENLLPVQQLFSYGKIPMVHVYPTHNFSNIITQIFYAAVNGYRTLEPWAWNWLYYAAGFILLYFLLKKFIDPTTALLTSIFLPVLPVFDTYYSVLIIPAFTLIYLLKKQTYRRYSVFWIVNLFILLWRLDFGLAAAAAGIFVIIIFNAGNLIKKKSVTAIKSIMKNMCLSFLTVFGTGLLIYGIIIIASGESVAEVLKQNLMFLKIQAPSMAYKDMYRQFGPAVILQYLVLPALGLFYICHFIFMIIIKKKTFSSRQLLIIFLAVLSLVLSVRSLQRHSLMEHFSPYLFIFLAMCLPFYLKKIKRRYAYILFFLVLLIYLIAHPLHLTRTWDGGVLEAHYSRFIQIPQTEIFRFNKWEDKESRLQINDHQYRELVTFINNNLKQEQTFYDFTNYPLLYVLADREFPLYFIPQFYQTSETIQKISVSELSEMHQQQRLPLIIFKNNTWWDFVDNVPNEIRTYKITEFIYKNYQPFININNYQLWLDTNLKQSQFNTSYYRPVNRINQHFDLKKLPYIWGNYDPYQAVNNRIQQTLEQQEVKLNKYDFLMYHLKPAIDKSRGNYLHLQIKSKKTDTIDIIYGKNTDRMITFDVIPSSEYKDYVVRISSQWQWMNNEVETLIIDSGENLEIGGVYIREGD